jgi:hypothetical protein
MNTSFEKVKSLPWYRRWCLPRDPEAAEKKRLEKHDKKRLAMEAREKKRDAKKEALEFAERKKSEKWALAEAKKRVVLEERESIVREKMNELRSSTNASLSTEV